MSEHGESELKGILQHRLPADEILDNLQERILSIRFFSFCVTTTSRMSMARLNANYMLPLRMPMW